MSLEKLVEQARQGDRVCLGRLLMAHDLRLRRHVARRIAADLQGVLSAEDVLQETYVEAYRHIARLEPRGDQAFYHWLVAIADHKQIDAVKALRAGKRPPPHRAERVAADRTTSFVGLGQLIDRKGRTPSTIVAREEAVRAVQLGLAALPEPCRRAIWMRHIEGRGVSEIAAALGRTERAVHQLCYRGLVLLREKMGSRSNFISESE